MNLFYESKSLIFYSLYRMESEFNSPFQGDYELLMALYRSYAPIRPGSRVPQ